MSETPGALVDKALKSVEAECRRIESRVERLQDQIRQAEADLEGKKKELSSEQSKLLHMQRERSKAVKQALKEAGVELEPAPKTPAPAQPAASAQAGTQRGASSHNGQSHGPGGRMTRQAMMDAAERVVGVMDKKAYKSKSQIAAASGVASDQLQSVLLKLKRDGRAQSNGQRGGAAGWRAC